MLKLNIICFLRAEQIKSSIILRSLFLIFEWQLCKRRYASCHIGGTFFWYFSNNTKLKVYKKQYIRSDAQRDRFM